jgi:hypothetical protein
MTNVNMQDIPTLISNAPLIKIPPTRHNPTINSSQGRVITILVITTFLTKRTACVAAALSGG